MSRAAGWILYEDGDYEANRSFARMMAREAEARGFRLETVLRSQITLTAREEGLGCLRGGRPEVPDFVISRQRDSFVSAHLEGMGVPVFNGAKVCELCNDKRKTHGFLRGVPMLGSLFLSAGQTEVPTGTVFPVVLKPAASHGGDRVFWVHTEAEWRAAAGQILPEPMIQQETASDYGRDLRVYVVFGEIVAGVMRRAREGFLSNYSKGGEAALHALTPAERALAEEVTARFQRAGAPLYFAGIDFLYHHGEPVLSEVEDVVGSRMLYRASSLHIAGLVWDRLAAALSGRK